MHNGREKKTKASKPNKGGNLKNRDENEAAAEEESHARKRDKPKKGGKHKNRDKKEEFGGADSSGPSSQGRGGVGTTNSLSSLSENIFMNWEELLCSREGLKRRVDTIAAVHGWEGQSLRKSFLGGIEPGPLLQSIRAEIATLNPASEALERADLLLELQAKRAQLEVQDEEKHRLLDDMRQLQEDCFEARDLLAGQGD